MNVLKVINLETELKTYKCLTFNSELDKDNRIDIKAEDDGCYHSIHLSIGREMVLQIIAHLCKIFNIRDSELIRINLR